MDSEPEGVEIGLHVESRSPLEGGADGGVGVCCYGDVEGAAASVRLEAYGCAGAFFTFVADAVLGGVFDEVADILRE